jgi:hypothetical protein
LEGREEKEDIIQVKVIRKKEKRGSKAARICHAMGNQLNVEVF